MNGSAKFALALAAMAFAQQLDAQQPVRYPNLVVHDTRLAAIADRMLTANEPLCRKHMRVTGIVLYTIHQYATDSVGYAFTNGPIAIRTIVPGSAADLAGLRSGDGLVAIGTLRTSTLIRPDTPRHNTASVRDAAYTALTEFTGESDTSLTIARDGQERTVQLEPPVGCRALVEILTKQGLNAESNGYVISVNYGVAAAATDDELAAVFAHEMGHLVLEHRRRLEAAGVMAGVMKDLFGSFGRNGRLTRQAEIEADQMSAHLLANAGYDPSIASAFWRSRLGRRTDVGIFRPPSTLSPKARAELIDREIATYLSGRAGPSIPAHLLAGRDVPFD